MTEIAKSALVPYSSEKMLCLVEDIESYPDFLKWCVSGKVFEQKEDEKLAGLKVRVAGMEIAFKTRNSVTHQENDSGLLHSILDMRLVDGPFKSLYGHWEFIALEEQASKITLNLNYDFKSGLFNHIVSSGFEKIAQHLVRDFITRAEKIYVVG
ncbi:type II toxin-antitoxin system RatA family toxin [Marinicella sp. W31]|uniref:type II toxin-antitoxin system RatA family toxin n=1 Tax=Marinicella sp. W31 TaxID=3023713 RepID=UPI003756334B